MRLGSFCFRVSFIQLTSVNWVPTMCPQVHSLAPCPSFLGSFWLIPLDPCWFPWLNHWSSFIGLQRWNGSIATPSSHADRGTEVSYSQRTAAGLQSHRAEASTAVHRRGLKSWLYCLSAWWSWACWETAPSLSLLIYRMGRISLCSKSLLRSQEKKLSCVTRRSSPYAPRHLFAETGPFREKKTQSFIGGRMRLAR